WLSKPEVVVAAIRAIVDSAVATHGAAGYLDRASRPDGAAGPFWLAPRGRSPLGLIEQRLPTARVDAAPRPPPPRPPDPVAHARPRVPGEVGDRPRLRLVRLRRLGFPRATARRRLVRRPRPAVGARPGRDPGPDVGAELPVRRAGGDADLRPAGRGRARGAA